MTKVKPQARVMIGAACLAILIMLALPRKCPLPNQGAPFAAPMIEKTRTITRSTA